MTIQININVYLCIAIIALLTICVIAFGVTLIIVCKSCKRFRRQLDETNRLLYFNHLDYRNTSDRIVDTQYQIELIHDNVQTLATNLQIHINKEREKANRKIFPRPELAKQITATIREQFGIFLILSKNLKAPSNDYLENITHNVLSTYPEIEPEYIINKCIAITQQELDSLGSSE